MVDSNWHKHYITQAGYLAAETAYCQPYFDLYYRMDVYKGYLRDLLELKRKEFLEHNKRK